MSSMKDKISALRQLEDREGRLTPKALIKLAKPTSHPMHDDFDWDDRVAGHKHRLNQARQIISSVRVMITTETKIVTSVGYVRDPDAEGEQGYRSVTKIRDEHDTAMEALLAETARVQAMLERARELAAALDLEGELNIALEGVNALSSRLRRGPPEIRPQ